MVHRGIEEGVERGEQVHGRKRKDICFIGG